MKTSRTLRTFVGTCALALALAPAALAQSTQTNTRTSSVVSGQKTKLKGAIVRRDSDSFVVQDDLTGAQTTVVLNDRTSVKTKGGFLGGGTKYALAAVTRGLHVEIEGRGDSSGNLVADKVRFTDADLRAARTLEANIVPVEGRIGTAETRVGEVEQNAQRMSGQLDELAAVSNAAAGGAVAAQETADRNVNRRLSEQRAESVVRYLVENHNVPLRRILTPFGYGAMNPLNENKSRDERAENRRAEVRVLVNRGLTGTPGDGTKVSAAT